MRGRDNYLFECDNRQMDYRANAKASACHYLTHRHDPVNRAAIEPRDCAMAPKIMMCEQAMPLLAAMQAETRDPQWAAPMEALIAKSMRVGGKGWAQIRALECRSTHCALEYAVYLDDLDHNADGSEELERLMEPLGGIVAPEMPQGLGKPMMVSVLVWKRRS